MAGLTQFLADQPDLVVTDLVRDRRELFTLLEKHEPDLLIVDYNIPGYVTTDDIQTVTDRFKNASILIISSDDNKVSIVNVLQRGVQGYLTKECSREEVILAVQATAKGEKFFCSKILDILMERSFSTGQEVTEGSSPLTVREKEILRLIASGRSNIQIAEYLYLSPHTIHTHRKSIIRKLNIKSPTEFVIHAMDMGLIKAK